MDTNADTESQTASSTGVGGVAGMENRRWYVAIVGNNTEKSALERLERLHYEAYVAKQAVLRVWKNGRKAMVDRVVIPSMVFVKCTEKERREIVALPFINRFLTNKAASSAPGMTKPLAVIPQRQIDILRFMLGQSDVPVDFVDTPFRRHDRIKIVRGSLKGVEGEVLQVHDGKSEVIVRIEMLGSARMAIDSVNLQLVRS